MLRPLSLYHFHSDSWQDIFDVALLLQNGKSTLIRTQTDIRSMSLTVTASLVRTIRQMRIKSLSPFSLHLITVAWHTPSDGLSLVAACCSIETCKKNKCPLNMHFLKKVYWLVWLICEWFAHLMTCSRVCKPKCLTTAGWALSANCKPHGTQKELLSLNSSQNCVEK